ncbi:hypothetical protein EIP75_22125 [Aquabacterium soli]|uniref:Uncharacterized protein n=1 Tax=Aquabacterium soli TaxID=2493092 RepID=A0A426V2L0_9BURK|nr:hypothetical protein [Aquabacterium soli]RRS01092.1 hypothetical protein EIP75_22125 [Aquabacterium soli]
MLTFSTHKLRDLFLAAGVQPTQSLLDLALPEVLLGALRVYYTRSMGPAFKAPPPAGAERDAVWYIDERRLTVLVGRLSCPLAELTYEAAEDALDDIYEMVDEPERRLLLIAFMQAVEFGTELTRDELRELRAYAVAAGM